MLKVTEQCIQWIREYFAKSGGEKAIIGISGGKDSTIAAALCVKALGKDCVIGVLMPNGSQNDIADSREVCKCLDIENYEVNIGDIYRSFADAFKPYYIGSFFENTMIGTNLPARIRMSILYTVAACFPNSRVVNTCNRSEDYVGYSTKFGDAAGDFSPLGNFTVSEVLEIGDDLGLPAYLVHKAPSDGMCGKTDEDNLGFTYKELDQVIQGTGTVPPEIYDKIQRLHKATRHKYTPMPTFIFKSEEIDHDET